MVDIFWVGIAPSAKLYSLTINRHAHSATYRSENPSWTQTNEHNKYTGFQKSNPLQVDVRALTMWGGVFHP